MTQECSCPNPSTMTDGTWSFFIDLHITYTTILWASFFVWRALDMFSLVNIDSGSKSNILWKFLCNISFHNHHLQAHVITIKKIGRDQVKLFAVHSFFFPELKFAKHVWVTNDVLWDPWVAKCYQIFWVKIKEVILY